MPITIRAGQAVAHRGWIAAREAALAALRSGPCVVAVAGAPGTGKTLLLEELARVLGERGVATTLHQRGDLGQDEAANARNAHAAVRVVLIDEADRMDPAVLTRLAADNGSGLVLARKHLPADGEADPLCEAASGGRPVTFVRLAPLLPGETGAFLRERLARAGYSGNVVGDAAVAGVEAFSGGVPRLVNMLASAALFLAASNDAVQVDAEHVAEAAALRGLTALPERGQPAPFNAPPQPDEGEPPPISARVASGATSPDPAPPHPVPPILAAVETDHVPMAQPAAAAPLPAPRSPATDRPSVLRRAAILALCTVAGSAAAAGWLVWHQTGSATARQSARAGTASALPPAGARAVAASNVAQAAQGAAKVATSIPPAAEPPPRGSKPVPAPAPLTPPAPSPSAVASSSARPSPVTPVPSPPPATARGQTFAAAGPRPPHNVEPKTDLPPPDATNAPAHPPPASLAARQSSQSAPSGTTSALPQPAEGRVVVPSAVAAAQPPAAHVATPTPAPAKPPPIQSKLASAPAPLTPPPAAAPTPGKQVFASLGAKALPLVPGAVAPNPAPPSRLAGFVPPLPPTSTPTPADGQSSAHTGAGPTYHARPEVDRSPSYATKGPSRARTGGWGPLLLGDLRRHAPPPAPAPTREAQGASAGHADFPPLPYAPPPPEPQSRPAPPRYVGIYVTGPDGRRTFIASP